MKTVVSPTSLAMKCMLRDVATSKDDLRRLVRQLGQNVGEEITKDHLVREREITTASNHVVRGHYIPSSTSVVVSTKGDFELFGWGVADRLPCPIRAYMNFEGVRGPDALTAEIREMVLPAVQGSVDLLVIAKAVLATGCTAMSLARTAYAQYMPKQLVIVTIFYTAIGVHELKSGFPNAELYVVGDCDQMNDDGSMNPGFGYFDGRLHD